MKKVFSFNFNEEEVRKSEFIADDRELSVFNVLNYMFDAGYIDPCHDYDVYHIKPEIFKVELLDEWGEEMKTIKITKDLNSDNELVFYTEISKYINEL